MKRPIPLLFFALLGLLLTSGRGAFASDQEVDQEELGGLMKLGQKEREAGDLAAAIEAFHTILSNRPSLHRARLELAITQYQLLDVEQARSNAEIVLNSPDTSESVKDAIRAFIKKLDKLEQQLARRHVWKPSVSLGLLYDDNVNRAETDVVGDVDDALSDPDEETEADTALVLTAGISHRYQFPRTVQMGQRSARTYWQSQASLYRKDYFSEDDFNLDVVSISTGPAMLSPNRWRANLSLREEYIRYGDEELAWFTSLIPSVTWQVLNGELTWDVMASIRDYTQPEDEGLDSDYQSTGVSMGHFFMGRKIALNGGLRIFNEDADDQAFSNDGYQLFLGANFRPAKTASYYAKVSYWDKQYDAIQSGDLVARDEQEWQLSLGTKYTLAKTFLEDWTLGLGYTFTERNSNVPRFTYDRSQVLLSIGRSF